MSLKETSEIIVTDYFIPNGVDDTKDIQRVIDFARKNHLKKIFFPKGTYMCNSVTIYPSIVLEGEEGTVLKKTPNGAKFSRMLTTYSTSYKYQSETDAPQIIIKNIDFDGNYENQGSYTNYELEQQHLIFLSAAKQSKGRIAAIIENCNFKNGVADAISVYVNADVTVKNCTAENVFRGGVTITGGNSKVNVNNFKAFGDKHLTGIDVEIDGAGYKNSTDVDVTMSNIDLAGDFDVGIRGGMFKGDSIYVRNSPFHLHAPSGRIEIINSHFQLSKNNIIYFPKNISFKNSSFETMGLERGESLFRVINGTSYRVSKENRLSFTDCSFRSKNGKAAYAIQIAPDNAKNNNRVIIKNCNFEDFQKALHIPQGGGLEVRNSVFAGERGIEVNSTKHYNYHLELNNCDFKKTQLPLKRHNVTELSRTQVDNKILDKSKTNSLERIK